MTVLTVVVESSLSGALAGFQGISVDDCKPVQEVINQYCSSKIAPVRQSLALMTKNGLVLVNDQPLSDFLIGDGDILSLIELRQGTILEFREWIIMSGFAMFLGMVGLLTCVLLFAVFRTIPNNYSMLIAVESPSTRITLYSWPSEKPNGTGEVMGAYSIADAGTIGRPGAPQENVTSDLNKYFEEINEIIPKESRKDKEVFFSGLEVFRLLNESDPEAAKKIVSGIDAYIKASGWKYKESSFGTNGILSGEDEGIGNWISTNLYASLLKAKEPHNVSYGILDLGEISTQITLEIDGADRDQFPIGNVKSVELFRNRFHLLSRSYLCHGREEALRRYRGILLLEQDKSNKILSPCEPPILDDGGVGRRILPSTYFESVCTKFVEQDDDQNVEIIGTGNHEECGRVIAKLLNYTECSETKMGYCLDVTGQNGFPEDFLQRKYYAISGFNDIFMRAEIPSSVTKTQFEFYMKRICDYSFLEGNGTVLDDWVDNKLCFELQYAYHLLRDVYGFVEDKDWLQITFSDKFEGFNQLDWTLGYITWKTNTIDTSSPVPTRLKVFPFSLLTILFGVFIALSVGFAVHGFRIRKNTTEYRRKHLLLLDHQIERFIEPPKTV